MEKPPKPLDRWLGLFGVAVGIVYALLPKTPLVISFSLVVIAALLIHPLWNFWWIEDRLWKQVVACFALLVALVLLGRSSWPDNHRTLPTIADPRYAPTKNKAVRVDAQLEPPSNQMCTGMPDDDRIQCLCPRLVPYSIEALPPPDSDNYAALLTIRSPREPMYKIRVFLRGVFSEAITVFPNEEMLKNQHFSIIHGFMDYDRYSFIVQSTAPQAVFKVKLLSSTGPRVICINQVN